MIRTISADGPTRVDLNTHDVRQKANTFQFDSSDQTLCENWLSSGHKMVDKTALKVLLYSFLQHRSSPSSAL